MEIVPMRGARAILTIAVMVLAAILPAFTGGPAERAEVHKERAPSIVDAAGPGSQTHSEGPGEAGGATGARGGTPSAWWDADWPCRMKLTFDNSGQSEDLVNFPVLVTLSPSNFNYARAKPDGADLRFIDADNITELNYEIEEWNASGNSCIWVNVTCIDGGSSSDHIWMYYGNSGASSGEDPTGVWDENYLMVQHLNETDIDGGAGDIKDSTSNDNDGTTSGLISNDQVPGKIDGSFDFDGNNDYVNLGESYWDGSPAGKTFMFWFQRQGTGAIGKAGIEFVLGKGAGTSNGYGFGVNQTTGVFVAQTNSANAASSLTIVNDTWYHISVVANATNFTFYINGLTDTSPAYTYAGDNDIVFSIGRGGNGHFNGIIDEVRISNKTRSADWLAAQYLSMNDSFITYGQQEPVEWWDTSWDFRMKLTFDNLAQSEDLVYFPVLVILNSSNFNYSRAQPDGYDLRFVDMDGSTVLNYEIEEWNASGNSYVWVNVTCIDGGSSSDHIWMYYGNAGAGSGEYAQGVWDEDFKGVWHLDETSKIPGTYNDTLDSTSNGNHGESKGGTVLDFSGKVDGAHRFDGDDDHVDIPLSPSLNISNDITIGAWVKRSNTTQWASIFSKTEPNIAWDYAFYIGDSDALVLWRDGENPKEVASSPAVTDTSWHYVAMTRSGTNLNFYVDGSDTGDGLTMTGAFRNDATTVRIGFTGEGGSAFDGSIDEVRVSDTARSADWIRAEYLTMNGNFVTYGQQESIAWWDANWSCRMKLTFDNLAQSEDLANFPVLVTLNSSNFNYTRAQPDGDDLRFVDADDETVLSYEIESWNASGNSYVWVNVTCIDRGSTTDLIWMYYGNPEAGSGENADGVWEGNYAAVWHLDETSKTAGTFNDHLDSTSNGNHGEAVNGVTMSAAGKVDGAVEFDGTDDYITMGDVLDHGKTDPVTYSAWIKTDVNHWQIAGKTTEGASFQGSWFYLRSTGGISLELYDSDGKSKIKVSTEAFDDGQWHYVAATYDGSENVNGIKLYGDGSELGVGASNDDALGAVENNYPFNIGAVNDGGGDYECNGTIDEVRVSNTARSADWIRAEYLSMGGTFVDYGPDECIPYVTEPIKDLSIAEDAPDDSIDLSLVFEDLDTPLLNFSYEGEGAVDVNISAQGQVTLTPPPDWYGVEHITFNAWDEHISAREGFNLTVLPVDDPPVIAPIGDIHASQGESIYIQAVGNDTRDGETVQFFDNSSLFYIDPALGNASFVPGNSLVASYPVSVWVQDENNSKAYANFTVVINNVNDAPEILSLGGVNTAGVSGPGSILDPVNLAAIEDVRTNWTATWVDIDRSELGCDEGLTFALHAEDPQVNIACDPATGNISCLPVQAAIDRTGGTITGWLALTDSGGLEDRAYFTIDMEEVNDPPTRPDFTWKVVGSQGVEGDDQGYDVAFTGIPSFDEEGDDLTYTWDFGDGTVYEDPGSLSVVVTFPSAATYRVTLSVEDEGGNEADRSHLVIISGQFQEPEPDEKEDGEDGVDGVDEMDDVEPPEGEVNGTGDEPSHGGPKDVDIDGISDHDGDGLPDRWEREHGFDPFDPTDAFLDRDGDGRSNLDEYCEGTDPSVPDAPADGREGDGGEALDGSEPGGYEMEGAGAGDHRAVSFALILCIPFLFICIIAVGLVVWSRRRKFRHWEEVFSMDLTGVRPLVVVIPHFKMERQKRSALLELKALMDGAAEASPRKVPGPSKPHPVPPRAARGYSGPDLALPRAKPVERPAMDPADGEVRGGG